MEFSIAWIHHALFGDLLKNIKAGKIEQKLCINSTLFLYAS
jgi:hypothetical protein